MNFKTLKYKFNPTYNLIIKYVKNLAIPYPA